MRRNVIGLTLMALTGACMAEETGRVTEYRSPAGVPEKCIAIAPMPGGIYTEQDRHSEDAYCEIDFYSDTVAVCPKIWSTSPATMLHDVSQGPYAGRARDFESEVCRKGTHARDLAHRELATFKITMNARDTSATFSTASLLYYHFSRYLEADVHVPVSVYRSMDKQAHHDRVAIPGIRMTEGHSNLKMIHAAWIKLVEDEETPGTYQPSRELFTADREDVFGVLLNQEGRRYSEEINGTRESGWGDGQSRDFQRTPAYVALSTQGSLADAIAAGRKAARAHPKFARHVTEDTPDAQFVFWMKELTEITLLDYIFSQQDRIGNIDYLEYWYWVENGQVRRQRASGGGRPDGVPTEALLLRRSQLNDNDAGGKVQYANYTKRTGMLEKIRHYSPKTYERLMALNADFESRGSLYRHVADSFGLSDRQLAQIVGNTAMAAGLLKSACKSGSLRFDLDPDGFLLGAEDEAVPARCRD